MSFAFKIVPLYKLSTRVYHISRFRTLALWSHSGTTHSAELLLKVLRDLNQNI